MILLQVITSTSALFSILEIHAHRHNSGRRIAPYTVDYIYIHSFNSIPHRSIGLQRIYIPTFVIWQHSYRWAILPLHWLFWALHCVPLHPLHHSLAIGNTRQDTLNISDIHFLVLTLIRPAISIGAAHLRSKYHGMLYIAFRLSGKDCIYIIHQGTQICGAQRYIFQTYTELLGYS